MSLIKLAFALTMWTLTLVRFRDFLSLKAAQHEKAEVAKIICWMLLFASMTLTFKISEFTAIFNTYTFPNLSILVTHLSFLGAQYFLTVTTLTAIGTPATKSIIRWIRTVLFLLITALSVIYIFHISKLPPYIDTEPQPESLPIIIFKFLSYPFGIMLCGLTIITYLVYLPSEKFSLLRLRAIMIILANCIGGMFITSRMVIFAGYFWPFLLSDWFLALSNILFIGSVGLFFGAFLSDRIYVWFVFIPRRIESWQTFHDLKYLLDRLIVLCPVIGLPPENPSFLRFLLKPEYYLYRAVIIILDSKALLADFFSDSVEPETPQIVWEARLLPEAIRIHQALQTANPSNDFADIVETYRRVSRNLFASQKNTNGSIIL